MTKKLSWQVVSDWGAYIKPYLNRGTEKLDYSIEDLREVTNLVSVCMYVSHTKNRVLFCNENLSAQILEILFVPFHKLPLIVGRPEYTDQRYGEVIKWRLEKGK